MQRQDRKNTIAAISAFSLLVLATSAQAFPEQERNSTSNPQNIGRISSVPVQVSGKIQGSSDEDVFRFALSPGQDVKATLTVSSDIDLEIIQDTNPDGKLAGGDTKKISINEGSKTEEVVFKNMTSKYGFVRIMDSGGAGLNRDVNYNLTLTAVPANGQPIIQSR